MDGSDYLDNQKKEQLQSLSDRGAKYILTIPLSSFLQKPVPSQFSSLHVIQKAIAETNNYCGA